MTIITTTPAVNPVEYCEYCNQELNSSSKEDCQFIQRHSQPDRFRHKQGIITICNNCIQTMYLRGDLVIGAYSKKYEFVEDIKSQYKF